MLKLWVELWEHGHVLYTWRSFGLHAHTGFDWTWYIKDPELNKNTTMQNACI